MIEYLSETWPLYVWITVFAGLGGWYHAETKRLRRELRSAKLLAESRGEQIENYKKWMAKNPDLVAIADARELKENEEMRASFAVHGRVEDIIMTLYTKRAARLPDAQIMAENITTEQPPASRDGAA